MKFAEVLEMMGAKVTWTDTSVTVTGPPRQPFGRKHLKAVDVTMNKMPAVAMTLAVVALFADGPTAIRDGKLFMASHTYHVRSDYSVSMRERTKDLKSPCYVLLLILFYMFWS